jgi:hypothetical protein
VKFGEIQAAKLITKYQLLIDWNKNSWNQIEYINVIIKALLRVK